MDSLIKTVTVLYEIIQFLSGIFHNILVQLYSMVHTKWSFEEKKDKNINTIIYFKPGMASNVHNAGFI